MLDPWLAASQPVSQLTHQALFTHMVPLLPQSLLQSKRPSLLQHQSLRPMLQHQFTTLQSSKPMPLHQLTQHTQPTQHTHHTQHTQHTQHTHMLQLLMHHLLTAHHTGKQTTFTPNKMRWVDIKAIQMQSKIGICNLNILNTLQCHDLNDNSILFPFWLNFRLYFFFLFNCVFLYAKQKNSSKLTSQKITQVDFTILPPNQYI